MNFWLYNGDCIEVMKQWPDATFDAVVCDPPYELTQANRKNPPPYVDGSPYSRHRVGVNGDAKPIGGFMGKEWDGTGVAFDPKCWAEVLRMLKPGAHLLAFGGTRTYHRMTCAIEDAGFEIRDSLHWIYGTGFPKSLNVGEGRGTALKPAHEPIVLARKPLEGTVASNMERFGTGALNIDACRIETHENLNGGAYSGGKRAAVSGDTRTVKGAGMYGEDGRLDPDKFEQPKGRWPANLLLDEDAAAELDAQSGEVGAAAPVSGDEPSEAVEIGGITNVRKRVPGTFHSDSGGASRFFYCAKPSKAERNLGLDEFPTLSGGEATDRKDGSAGTMSPRAGAGRTGGKVLDLEVQVKYPPASWVDEGLSRVLQADTVQSLKKGTVGSLIRCRDGSVWSMCWCGSPSTGQCLQVAMSIIGTRTNWTTEKKTWLPSPRLHTNGCMADAFGVLAAGGSPVEFALP